MANQTFWGLILLFVISIIVIITIIIFHVKKQKRQFSPSPQLSDLDSTLNMLDKILEDAIVMPFTGNCIVDIGRIRNLIDSIRFNIPPEIQQARTVVAEYNEILSIAEKEAEDLIRKAEERVRVLVDNNAIVRQANARGQAMLDEANQRATDMMAQTIDRTNRLTAQARSKATEILAQANLNSEEIRQAAYNSSEEMLRSTEETVIRALSEIKSFQQIILQGRDGN